MKRLSHLLIISKDTNFFTDRNYAHLEKALAKSVTVTTWRSSGHIQAILKKLKHTPDFILIVNDIGDRFEPNVNGLSAVSIPSALFVNDVHRFTERRRQFLRRNPTTYLFSVTRDACLETYPAFTKRMRWLPHFVEPTIFRDYGLPKDYDFLLLGAVNHVYPFRQLILKTFENHPGFHYQSHPGYSFQYEETKQLVGTRYAMEINKAHVFFTCPSAYLYPVKKYYEALACRSLLLAPSFPELEALGFIPGTHFVFVHEENLAEAATYYLNQKKERYRIMEKGFSFVHRYHTTEKRSEDILKQIEFILS
ncbi:glycosyltransferase [Alkalihalobacillus sp. LMS6]|uniref:glycosyltransferase n=1 Tax=Alkalihalobacillus sp. LMS6 TaxID=2924034 RepID=UPI0020D0EBEF|nr:glycosyltransferase [Alkalihalobacillus sp. LMS6]UTR08165.1 glycosyltransferase [Alkalihalobacillus sp. LMS6]